MAFERLFRLTPSAQHDLRKIWRYTAENWSVEQAESYQDQLYAAFEGLAEGIKKGRASTAKAGYLKYLCGAHMIYFRDRGDWLQIVRILHGAQDADKRL